MYELGQTDVLNNPTKYLQAIESSKYMHLASNILTAINNIMDRIINHKNNILVHCTDGWDRTAQLAALTEILLDGRFRTIRGFQQLIEKEWLSFGH